MSSCSTAGPWPEAPACLRRLRTMMTITITAIAAITRKMMRPTGKPPPVAPSPPPEPPPAASVKPSAAASTAPSQSSAASAGWICVLLDRGELLGVDRTRGVAREIELTAFGRHRQQVLRRTESVDLGGGVRPVLGAGRVGELVDEHHPQVQPGLGLELFEAGLRLPTARLSERAPDVVEHEARAEGHGVGRGCRTCGVREKHRERRRERHCPSRTHRSPPRGRAVGAPKIESMHARPGRGRC